MTRRMVRVEGIVPVVARLSCGRGRARARVRRRAARRPHRQDARLADLPQKFRAERFSDLPIADQAEGDFAADGWGAHENLDHVIKAAGSDEIAGAAHPHLDARQEGVPGLRAHPHGLAEGAGAEQLSRRRRCRRAVRPLDRARGAGGRAGRESRCFPERSTTRTFDNKDFPSAGFYSQAVRCGPLVFLAGHIPIETRKPGNPVILGLRRHSGGGALPRDRPQPSGQPAGPDRGADLVHLRAHQGQPRGAGPVDEGHPPRRGDAAGHPRLRHVPSRAFAFLPRESAGADRLRLQRGRPSRHPDRDRAACGRSARPTCR